MRFLSVCSVVVLLAAGGYFAFAHQLTSDQFGSAIQTSQPNKPNQSLAQNEGQQNRPPCGQVGSFCCNAVSGDGQQTCTSGYCSSGYSPVCYSTEHEAYCNCRKI